MVHIALNAGSTRHPAAGPGKLLLAFAAVVGLWSGAAGRVTGQTAAVIPPRIEEFLRNCETSRRGAIAQREYELRGVRAKGASSTTTVRRINVIEANLASLRANKEPVVPALHFPPEVGDIGRLPQLACHVDQIISQDEMLAHCNFSLKVRTVRNFQPRLETVVRPVSFLIDGVSTAQVSEGADVPLLDVFEIAGRRTYRSVGGESIEVLVLAPFDMKAIEPYFRAITSAR
ncbi:MAG: hypothetical protein WD845_12235 [Pirellulales bacterium]